MSSGVENRAGRARRPGPRPPRPCAALNVPDGVRLRVSPGGFGRLCAANPDLRLERTAEGGLIVMSPAGSDSGRRNHKLALRLGNWDEADGTGVAFDSSTGFTLPNGAVRSPDASWLPREVWEALSPQERDSFAPVCPEFVAELRSPSDRLDDLQAKMREYAEQGVKLGWLIDPIAGNVEVYRAGGGVEVFDKPLTLSGEPILPGFVLDLRGILFEEV